MCGRPKTAGNDDRLLSRQLVHVFPPHQSRPFRREFSALDQHRPLVEPSHPVRLAKRMAGLLMALRTRRSAPAAYCAATLARGLK
jgi:hypothetical protein